MRKGVKCLQTSKHPSVPSVSRMPQPQEKEFHTKPGSRTGKKVQKNRRLFASTVPKSELLVHAEKEIQSLQMSPVHPLPALPENFEIMKITQTDYKWSPMVLVLGWAGAKHKNLQKYCKIYQDLGCSTAALTLPADCVLNSTEMLPRLLEEQQVIKQLEDLDIEHRDVIVHVLSDAGTMMYQALMSRGCNENLWSLSDSVKFVVWDSA